MVYPVARTRSKFEKLAAEGDPLKLAAFIPIGTTLRRKPISGGMYWYARLPDGYRYIGSDENKALLEQAWDQVSAQIAAVEQTPEGRRLRELEAVTRPSLARTSGDLVDIPILSQASAAALGGRTRPKR